MKKCKYLRIRVTDRCNLKCTWCHNEGGINKSSTELSVEQIERAVRLMKDLGYKKIKLAGGEPTVRKDLVEIVYALSHIPGIDLSLISNGTLLTENRILELKRAGLSRINLSINTIQETRYKTLQGGHRNQLNTALGCLDLLIKLGMEKPKINFIYLGPQSDNDLYRIMDLTKKNQIKIAILNILPGHKSKQFTYISSADLLDRVLSMGVRDINCSVDHNSLNVLSFTMKNGAILEIGHHLMGQEYVYKSCKDCTIRASCLETVYSHRLTPDGLLQPCLLRQDNCFDLRSFISNIDSSEVTIPKIKSYFRKL
jgi:cyclic pyranopterin phosphate synthase